jgi:hypothetical protein
MTNISQMSSAQDRDFFRVDGPVYLMVEAIEIDHGTKLETYTLEVPTFSLPEDDIVGLSIDAFREHVKISEMEKTQKEYWLQMQQIVSMMKRFLDAELLGRKQKLFKKTEVNISGSGMAFPSETAYVVKQNLRISMFFPRYPFNYICVIGEVVKCEKKDDGYLVKTHFEGISEKSQDEILRFVNQIQRDNRRR